MNRLLSSEFVYNYRRNIHETDERTPHAQVRPECGAVSRRECESFVSRRACLCLNGRGYIVTGTASAAPENSGEDQACG